MSETTRNSATKWGEVYHKTPLKLPLGFDSELDGEEITKPIVNDNDHHRKPSVRYPRNSSDYLMQNRHESCKSEPRLHESGKITSIPSLIYLKFVTSIFKFLNESSMNLLETPAKETGSQYSSNHNSGNRRGSKQTKNWPLIFGEEINFNKICHPESSSRCQENRTSLAKLGPRSSSCISQSKLVLCQTNDTESLRGSAVSKGIFVHNLLRSLSDRSRSSPRCPPRQRSSNFTNCSSILPAFLVILALFSRVSSAERIEDHLPTVSSTIFLSKDQSGGWPPSNLTVECPAPRTVRLLWPSRPGLAHKVAYWPLEARPGLWDLVRYVVVLEVEEGRAGVVLQRLLPDTVYRVTVTAADNTSALWARTATFRTLPEEDDPEDLLQQEPQQQKYLVPKGSVRLEEVTILLLVMLGWMMAIGLFFNRWGKIRMLEPWQEPYKEVPPVRGAVRPSPHSSCYRHSKSVVPSNNSSRRSQHNNRPRLYSMEVGGAPVVTHSLDHAHCGLPRRSTSALVLASLVVEEADEKESLV